MDPGAPMQAQPAPAQPLPPPPPPFSMPDPGPPAWQEQVKIAGRLAPTWRLAFGFGWAATVVCNAAVWSTSRVIGLSTWWLGPDSEPRLLLMQLLPFYLPLAVTIAAISNWRYLPYFGIFAAAVGAAIGAGDLDRVKWIAVVELVIAGSALCISVASLVGMYRPVKADASTTLAS